MQLAARWRRQALIGLALVVATSLSAFVAARAVQLDIERAREAVQLMERVSELANLAATYQRSSSERQARLVEERTQQLRALVQTLPAMRREVLITEVENVHRAFGELRGIPDMPVITADHRMFLQESALGQIDVATQRMLEPARAQLALANRSIDERVLHSAWLVLAIVASGGLLMLALDAQLTRALSKGLRTIGDAAQRLGRGESISLTDVPAIDELRALAGDLQRTRDQLSALATEREDTIYRLNEEAAARQSADNRLQLLALAYNDAIWDWDLVSNEFWSNDGLVRMVGRANDETPRSLDALIALVVPQEREALREQLRITVEGALSRWRQCLRLQHLNGTLIDVEMVGVVERNALGVAIRVVAGISDISEKLQVDEQMRQMQRLESLGQLTGGVAHDFNNLLTVILGNAEMLVERLPCDTSERRLAEMVGTAAQRGAELTQQLLAFARKQPLQPRAIDVNELLVGIDALLRRSLGEHIRVELVLAADLWPTLIDPAQLENATLNMAINARDAMPRGGRLTLATANIRIDRNKDSISGPVQPGEYVLLSVADTGAGISPEHLGRVFEPFFTTKDKGKGTGLGLAMVFGFVKQSGGQIDVLSSLGQGSVFKVYLPRMQAPASASTPTRLADPVQRGGGEWVLLVEDDPMVREYARTQLQELGYQVLEAGDGHQALAQLQLRSDIALLFTDVVMPGGLNGPELAQRAHAMRPGLPVLYSSGYTDAALVHHGRLDAGVLLLSKPYRRSELANMLKRAIACQTPGDL